MIKKAYYCLFVRRNYEEIWRVVDKFDTQEQAQAALDERRGYVGVFNYDNAEMRILSREEAKLEFGPKWEYHAIGEPLPGAARRAPAKKPVSAR